ncbi:MAG: aminotransferase class III-fold pyridoxal phosphate-dependent enzyme [Gemmatimonadaceae bacterium]
MDVGRNISRAGQGMVQPADAARIAESLFGVRGEATRLAGEYDDNFLITSADGARSVLKIAPAGERRELLELQLAAMEHILRAPTSVGVPRPINGKAGQVLARADVDGSMRFTRLLSYIPGNLLANIRPQSAPLLRGFGASLGSVDRALADFELPAARRSLQWDIARAADLRPDVHCIEDAGRRNLIIGILDRFEAEVQPVLAGLRHSIIHADANDYNVIVNNDRVVGLIDFGDMVHTATVCELAIGCAYVMLEKTDPLGSAAHVVAGYESMLPLSDAERHLLFPLMLTRLAMSVIVSAARKAQAPGEPYYTVHEAPAWAALEQLVPIPNDVASAVLFGAPVNPPSVTSLKDRRKRSLGRNLSLSYDTPLHIVRGWRQYLYAADGREYLDAYNNVPHVGHSHPRVVAAAAKQMALLNSNTRYLHDTILTYAERLTEKLPAPLSVCYFVNSGSEANELALRLARARSGGTDVIVSDGAYHGNTQELIEVSPYKYDGPGGAGRSRHVHAVPVADVYRGPYTADDPNAGQRYAAHVAEAIAAMKEQGRRLSAFLIESLLSAGGQIVLPPGYLRDVFSAVRSAGGVCIVDEVQVGFGRVGSHFWGFELQGVVPDIVVMGKPMGNGHPVGAVVTTPEIAASFDNGMEYFNTFGGNPVSMAAALEVLAIIEEDKLQANALRAGRRMIEGLRSLMTRDELIGDVRGVGLFVGIELVRDRKTREPAAHEAKVVVNRLKDEGILTGTEGPHRNVVKIKPPIVFDEANSDRLVDTLDRVLRLPLR